MSRPAWLPAHARIALRTGLLAWLAFLLIVLSGCGGGEADEDDDTRQQIPTPPACAASATRCL